MKDHHKLSSIPVKEPKGTALDRRMAIAPMMDRTDCHYRCFMRGLTRRTLLYTEMVTTGAVLHGERAHLLKFCELEHPVALQLGGSDPRALAQCAAIAEQWGYDEVNFNVGCPSPRVSDGAFGASLMCRPQVVADCMRAMQEATALPVTIKHRTGVDDMDNWDHLRRFVDIVATSGCQVFIVHARKAWLTGLSPKENREIPPLRHDVVRHLKAEFQQLTIVLNGGLRCWEHCDSEGTDLDGCMIGRAAYERPYLFATADRDIFGDDRAPIVTRRQAVEAFLPYVREELAAGEDLKRIIRSLAGLFHGEPGARAWRHALHEGARLPGANETLLIDALEQAEAGGHVSGL